MDEQSRAAIAEIFEEWPRRYQADPASFQPNLKELDEYEDATLMKQKIAACLAVVTSDVDGSAAALGTGDDTNNPGVDTLEPGAVLNIPPGRSVDVVHPMEPKTYGEQAADTFIQIGSELGVIK